MYCFLEVHIAKFHRSPVHFNISIHSRAELKTFRKVLPADISQTCSYKCGDLNETSLKCEHSLILSPCHFKHVLFSLGLHSFSIDLVCISILSFILGHC